MNPARRKLFHILSKNEKKQEEVEKTEVEKPAKKVVVEPPKVEVPVEEVKPLVIEEPTAPEAVEVVIENEGDQVESKPNLMPKSKKFKKDVEVGQ